MYARHKTVQEYWREVRQVQRQLEASSPDGVFVTMYGCHVKTCTPEVAAKTLVGGTGRLSTNEEIEAYRRDEQEAADLIRRQERVYGRIRKDRLAIEYTNPGGPNHE